MIERFKIVTGIYDKVVSPTMLAADSSYATRSHNFRLQKINARYDLRKYYFTNRVVNAWTSLSNYVVSAESVNCFKNRLDNFWKDQEIIYNFRAEIYGTVYSLIALVNNKCKLYVKNRHRDNCLSPKFLYVYVICSILRVVSQCLICVICLNNI